MRADGYFPSCPPVCTKNWGSALNLDNAAGPLLFCSALVLKAHMLDRPPQVWVSVPSPSVPLGIWRESWYFLIWVVALRNGLMAAAHLQRLNGNPEGYCCWAIKLHKCVFRWMELNPLCLTRSSSIDQVLLRHLARWARQQEDDFDETHHVVVCHFDILHIPMSKNRL